MNKSITVLFSLLCASAATMAQNKIGVNTNTPGSSFSVNGNTAIGTNYSAQAAPTNGLAVEGNVGIGILTPAAGLHIVNNDGIMVQGNVGAGNPLSIAGTGTRMFFYPKKVAFRAGGVSTANWDDANIGDYSTAFGGNTKANGFASTAFGIETTASGNYATATGYLSTASGNFSTALGIGTVASGEKSTAIGSGTIANNYASFAAGENSTASGLYTAALGKNVVASGNGSVAVGYNSAASQYAAFAAGEGANASGWVSIALGSYSAASATYSTAMGHGTTANAYKETTIGSFNTIDGTANAGAWVTTDRLFTVGSGTSPTARANAFVVYKNGSAFHYGNVSIFGNAEALAFNTFSDKRYKQNIVPISTVSGSALANLAAINGYYYDFRVNEFPEKKFSDAKQIGFIAQELEEVYPELVNTDKNGYKSVDYSKITPVLVEAIKELKAQNEALTVKAEKAEANYESLKTQVEKLNNATFGHTQK